MLLRRYHETLKDEKWVKDLAKAGSKSEEKKPPKKKEVKKDVKPRKTKKTD